MYLCAGTAAASQMLTGPVRAAQQTQSITTASWANRSHTCSRRACRCHTDQLPRTALLERLRPSTALSRGQQRQSRLVNRRGRSPGLWRRCTARRRATAPLQRQDDLNLVERRPPSSGRRSPPASARSLRQARPRRSSAWLRRRRSTGPSLSRRSTVE